MPVGHTNVTHLYVAEVVLHLLCQAPTFAEQHQGRGRGAMTPKASSNSRLGVAHPAASWACRLPASPGVRRVGRGPRGRLDSPGSKAGQHLRRPHRPALRRNQAARLRPGQEAAAGVVALSAPGSIYGTPQCMPSEQATGGKALDHRADLYALGGVAYYLLTGRPP